MSFGYQVLGFGAFPSRGPGAYVPTHAALFDGSADYLAVPFQENGNLLTFTFSCWIKRLSGFGAVQTVFGGLASDKFIIQFDATDRLDVVNENSGGSRNSQRITSSEYRDPSSWMHLVVQNDATQSTAGDRMKLYVNGTQLTAFYGTANLNQNEAGLGNTATTHWFGQNSSGGEDLNAMIAEAIFIDGVAYNSSVFGENDSSTGIWVPKNPIAGYGEDTQAQNIADWGGKNSFYFNFSDTNILGKNFRPTAVTANSGTYKIDYSVWFDGSADFLSWTPSSGSTNTSFTYSFWAKRSGLGAYGGVFGGTTTGSQSDYIRFSNNDAFETIGDDGNDWSVKTNGLYRDPTAWAHYVVSFKNTTDVRIWVNGVEITSFATNTESGTMGGWLRATAQYIGKNAANQYYNGYLAELICLDGTAVTDPSSFGGWDANGIWMPKDPSGLTYGTNGFLLQFKGDGSTFDSNADAGGVGADTSGRNNHFTGNSDIHNNRVTDTPTNTSGDNEGNYATFNPLKPTSGTFSDGNKKITPASDKMGVGTISFDYNDSNGYYMEFVPSDSGTGYVGLIHVDQASMFSDTYTPGSEYRYQFSNATAADQISDGGGSESNINAGVAWGAGDVVQIAVKGSDIWFGINNTWVNNGSGAGNPSTGANPCFTSMGANSTANVVPYCQASSSGTQTFTLNTGQSALAYSPPTNFKLLNTANLPAPTYSDPRKYFTAVRYEGTGSARSVRGCYDSTGTAWTPDWVWIKNRDQNDDHRVFDTIRGVSEYLETNSQNQQSQGNFVHGMLSDFIPGGFKVYNNVSVNTVNESYVAWCWEAGGKPTLDNAVSVSDGASMTSGSVFKGGSAVTFTPHNDATVFPHRMSIAEHGGFSIVAYQSTADTSSTMKYPHGLDRAPAMIINKCIDTDSLNWIVYHEQMTTSDAGAVNAADTHMQLNNDIISTHGDGQWGDVAPTAELVHLGTGGAINPNNKRCISYCFARVPGLIGIGGYTGNGSTDGPMVIVDDGASGFRPAWLMIKSVGAAGNWNIVDAARDPFNQISDGLRPNANIAEFSGQAMDFIANGFKLRLSGSDYNTSSQSYIYLAFADQEFSLQSRTR